jgi:hypothetical protein
VRTCCFTKGPERKKRTINLLVGFREEVERKIEGTNSLLTPVFELSQEQRVPASFSQGLVTGNIVIE